MANLPHLTEALENGSIVVFDENRDPSSGITHFFIAFCPAKTACASEDGINFTAETRYLHVPPRPAPVDARATRSRLRRLAPAPSASGKRLRGASAPKTCREIRRDSCRRKLERNQMPIIIETIRAGAALVTSERPIGER